MSAEEVEKEKQWWTKAKTDLYGGDDKPDVDYFLTQIEPVKLLDAADGSGLAQLKLHTAPSSALNTSDPLPNLIPVCAHGSADLYVSQTERLLLMAHLQHSNPGIRSNANSRCFAAPTIDTLLKVATAQVRDAVKAAKIEVAWLHAYAAKIPSAAFLKAMGLTGTNNFCLLLQDNTIHRLDVGFQVPSDVFHFFRLDLASMVDHNGCKSLNFEHENHARLGVVTKAHGGFKLKRKRTSHPTLLQPFEQSQYGSDGRSFNMILPTACQIQSMVIYHSAMRRGFQNTWGTGMRSGTPGSLQQMRQLRNKAEDAMDFVFDRKGVGQLRVEVKVDVTSVAQLKQVLGFGLGRSPLPTTLAEALTFILSVGGDQDPQFQQDGTLMDVEWDGDNTELVSVDTLDPALVLSEVTVTPHEAKKACQLCLYKYDLFRATPGDSQATTLTKQQVSQFNEMLLLLLLFIVVVH